MLSLTIGDEQLELFHGRGETNDAIFVWLPRRRVLVSGDFVIWMFPNAGNPRRVQRYAGGMGGEAAAHAGAQARGPDSWPWACDLRRERETSLMGRAFLAVYQRDAKARSEG